MEEAARALQHPIVAVAVIVPFMRPLLELLANFHAAGRMTNKIIEYIGKATDLNMIRARSSSTITKQQPSSESNKKFDNRQRLVDTIIDSLVNKRLDHEEFVDGLLFFQLAGIKTTADTLTWLVWQLSRYTHIQEQLRDSILKDGIESDYLSWCIKETIRIHPAVPLGTGRILGEDVTVNGLFLPKGTFVMPSTYSIHHDPDIWPEPDEFKPERWRDTSGQHPAAFMGFGLGPRNCLSGKLAVQEIKLAMQLLLGNYKLEVCSETAAESAFSSPLMLFTNLDRPIKVRLVALNKDHKRH
jgi:cytochrome P450